MSGGNHFLDPPVSARCQLPNKPRLVNDISPIVQDQAISELDFYKEKLKMMCEQFNVEMPVYQQQTYTLSPPGKNKSDAAVLRQLGLSLRIGVIKDVGLDMKGALKRIQRMKMRVPSAILNKPLTTFRGKLLRTRATTWRSTRPHHTPLLILLLPRNTSLQRLLVVQRASGFSPEPLLKAQSREQVSLQPWLKYQFNSNKDKCWKIVDSNYPQSNT